MSYAIQGIPGIGIITHQRKDLLKRCVDLVREHTEWPYYLFVAVDRSDDGTVEYLESENIAYAMSPAPGIAANRSTVLWHLKDFPYVVMFEDDSGPLKDGWLNRDVEALDKTGIDYLLHLTDAHGRVLSEVPYDGGVVQVREHATTQCIVITQKVIETVGYFAPEFGAKYGLEEVEWGERIQKAGLAPGWTSLPDSAEYVLNDWDALPADQVNSARRKQDADENGQVWMGLRTQNVIHRPYPYPENPWSYVRPAHRRGKERLSGEVSVETDHPVAVDSVDHIHPRGAKQDNTTADPFVAKMMKSGLHYMDLGCAGAGIVKQFHDSGAFSVGVEGSDYASLHQFAEWANIPDRLRTADISKPFRVLAGGEPVFFDLITAWEVLEHIPEESVPQVLKSIHDHLVVGGVFLGSISRSTDTYEGVEYHCTVRQPDWWVDRFHDAGLVEDQALYDYVEPDWPRGTTGSASFPVAYRRTDS